MKKIYLLGFSVLAYGSVMAQLNTESKVHELKTTKDWSTQERGIRSEQRAGGDIVWSNDFSNPATWVAGGAGISPDNGWTIGTACNGFYFTGAGNMGTTGNFARFINGEPVSPPTLDGDPPVYEGGPFTFTCTEVIDLSGVPAPSLMFEQYGARFITLQAVQVSTDGGTNWITVGTNDDITPLTSGGGSVYPKPQTRAFNITSAIAGNPSNVTVRLYWDGAMNGPSMNYVDYGWFVDNMRIIEGYDYDLQSEATFHRSGVGTIYAGGMEYYMIPESQITEIEFSGIMSNQGGSTHTGAALNVTVSDGSVVFSGSSAGVDLASTDTDSVAVTTAWTPSGLGVYDITYWFDGTNGEEVTFNDTVYDQLEVTEYMYARDNGINGGLISAVTSSPEGVLQIGNVFEIFADGVIGGAEVRISNAGSNEGQFIYVYLYKFDAGVGDYVLEGESDDYEIMAGDLDQFIHFVFEDAVEVQAGDDVLLVAGHYGGADPVEFRTAQPVDEGTVLGYIDGSAFQLLSPEAVMVRADFRDYTGIEETTTSNFSIGQNYPNPFDNTSTITYSLNETSDVSVQITDVTGKVVQTITPGTLAAGTYTLTIDGTSLAAGLYYYTFNVNGTLVTNQMIVSAK